MKPSRTWAAVGAAAFVVLVVASNWLTAEYGLVLGLVTAGTFTAGLTLAARDAVRESGGLALSFGCVLVGAGLSYFLSTPFLALASGAAFLLAETFDAFVYEPLRKSGKLRALAWSNVIGAIVDSLAFLLIAGFPLWPAIIGQIAVKWVVAVALPLLAVWGVRALLRDRFRPESA
jgi:uncharacterized PurR-regulated membrane protein YhhQ (DUF165 family)